MRELTRYTVDFGLAGLSMLLGIVLDTALLSIIKSHLKNLLAIPSYRAIYTPSGRRNRDRY